MSEKETSVKETALVVAQPSARVRRSYLPLAYRGNRVEMWDFHGLAPLETYLQDFLSSGDGAVDFDFIMPEPEPKKRRGWVETTRKGK